MEKQALGGVAANRASKTRLELANSSGKALAAKLLNMQLSAWHCWFAKGKALAQAISSRTRGRVNVEAFL